MVFLLVWPLYNWYTLLVEIKSEEEQKEEPVEKEEEKKEIKPEAPVVGIRRNGRESAASIGNFLSRIVYRELFLFHDLLRKVHVFQPLPIPPRAVDGYAD